MFRKAVSPFYSHSKLIICVAVILTGRPSGVEELVMPATVGRCRCSPALCCAARPAWPPSQRRAVSGPWPQDGQSAGSSQPVPAIAPPACLCLYLKVQHQVITWNAFCLTVEMTTRIFFSYENPVKAQKTKMRLPFHGWDLHSTLCPAWRSAQCCSAQSFQCVDGRRIIYTILFFFIMLAPINAILRGTLLERLSACLNGIIMSKHLLVWNVYVS